MEHSRDRFELLLFISASVRTEIHYEVYATVLTKHIFQKNKKDILEVKPFVSNKSGAVSSSLGYSASASTGVFRRKFGIHVGTDWICEMPSFVVEELSQRDSMLDGTTRQVIMEHSPEDFVKMPKMRSTLTGDSFDLWRTGWSTFVKIPLKVSGEPDKLLVRGEVRPYGGSLCAPSYLQQVRITGS